MAEYGKVFCQSCGFVAEKKIEWSDNLIRDMTSYVRCDRCGFDHGWIFEPIAVDRNKDIRLNIKASPNAKWRVQDIKTQFKLKNESQAISLLVEVFGKAYPKISHADMKQMIRDAIANEGVMIL